jgi:hypothetical protein
LGKRLHQNSQVPAEDTKVSMRDRKDRAITSATSR